MSHTAHQKNIIGLSNTQPAIIRDKWRHLELMEPHYSELDILAKVLWALLREWLIIKSAGQSYVLHSL